MYLIKMMNADEYEKLDIAFQTSCMVAIMILLTLSYKRDLKHTVYLSYTCLFYVLVMIWDPWNRAIKNSKQWNNVAQASNLFLVLN